MSNTKISSSPMATLASGVLKDRKSSEIARKLAGSVLSQASKGKETGKQMETLASRVLSDERSSYQAKQLAASVLSQSDSER